MLQRVDFLHIPFSHGRPEDVCRWVIESAAERYSFVVTPNAQHVVGLYNGTVRPERYLDADLVTCDSRILELLGLWCGKSLAALPGSDLVRSLLEAAPRGLRIGLFGPTRAQAKILRRRYPKLRFTFIEAPGLPVGHPYWREAVRSLKTAEWDVLLLCLSMPKNEYLAHALRLAGRSSGTALCVGASIDFLTGRQQRAPAWMRRARLEWLHRLLGDPRRMWRRYLLDSPQVLLIFLVTEVLRVGQPSWRTSGAVDGKST